MNSKTLYDFEGFRVDTNQKCLWRGEDIVSLTPKAFDTLLVLIKNKGNVVSKNSILDEVWKDTFVEEATLAQNISTLRKALAKYESNKEFIVTVPRRGYRFIADVTETLADEEVLVLEKHSVTHIVAEQEKVDDKEEISINRQTSIAKTNPLLIGIPLALVTFLLIGIGWNYFFSSSKNFYNSKFQKTRLNTLFSGGNILSLSASPDGKYVAFVERNLEGDAIFLKQIENGNKLEILPKSNLQIAGISFSPKSDHIYYSAYKKENSSTPKIGSLYKIPILGGPVQEIVKDIDSPVAISADAKKLAFIRNKLKEKQSALIVSNVDGSNEKELAVRDLQNRFSLQGVSFSPDGKFISAVTFDRNDSKLPTKLVIIDTEKGEEKLLTEQKWLWIGRNVWLKDGSGVALVAYGAESPNITDEIWFVSYPEGKVRLITNGIKGINGFSLTDDLDSIVATKLTRISSFYVSPMDDLDDTTEIAKSLDEESLLPLGSDWTKDQKIVYSKVENGNADIWMVNSDGTDKKQITSDKSADFSPKMSNDGRYIFFFSNRGEKSSVWRVDINGENPTEIIKTNSIFPPSFSQSSENIYYSAAAPKKIYHVLWKTNFDGKNTQQVNFTRTYGSQVSPDGKYVFCFCADNKELTKPLSFTILSAETGKIVKQFATLTLRKFPLVKWKNDSKSFLILDQNEGKSTLSEQMLDEDKPKKLKTWNSETIYQIAVSKDDKKLFFEKGKEVNSVIQLKNIASE